MIQNYVKTIDQGSLKFIVPNPQCQNVSKLRKEHLKIKKNSN